MNDNEAIYIDVSFSYVLALLFFGLSFVSVSFFLFFTFLLLNRQGSLCARRGPPGGKRGRFPETHTWGFRRTHPVTSVSSSRRKKEQKKKWAAIGGPRAPSRRATTSSVLRTTRGEKYTHKKQTKEKILEDSSAKRGTHQADGRRRGRVESRTQRSHTVGCRRQTRRTGSGPDTAVSFQPPYFVPARLRVASRRPVCASVPYPDPGTRLRQAACSLSHAPVHVTERFFSLVSTWQRGARRIHRETLPRYPEPSRREEGPARPGTARLWSKTFTHLPTCCFPCIPIRWRRPSWWQLVWLCF